MTFDEKLRYFANAKRRSAYECCAGPDKNFAPRYRAQLGDIFVCLETTPPEGYLTPGEAIAAAVEYQNRCKAFLETHV